MPALTTEQARDIKLGVELMASVAANFGQLVQQWQEDGSLPALARLRTEPEPPRWQAELARRRERKARR